MHNESTMNAQCTCRTAKCLSKKYNEERVFWIWHQHVAQPTGAKTKKKEKARQLTEKVPALSPNTLPDYPFPEPFDKMTRTNLIFVSGHTRNVGRKVRGEVFHEGKTKGFGKGRFMAYCSNQVDNKALEKEKGWKADPTIALSHIHLICRLTYEVSGEGHTKEGYATDWQYTDAYVLKTPILLPNGVGQGTGRYATFPINGKNKHLEGPFMALVEYMNKDVNIESNFLKQDVD